MFQVQAEMAYEGDKVSLSQLARWLGVPRRTLYYKPIKQSPKVNPILAKKIKVLIDELPFAGYRTLAFLLGLNRNTVQRINQIKGWQCRKRQIGFRPRAQAMPSVAERPNERWATDLTRVWCGQDDRWKTLSAVIDCHTREILGWRLSHRGNAKTAEATLEDALVNRFGFLARTAQPLTLRSDNGLVFTSRRFTVMVRSYGIKQEFITPYTPQQNGMIERLFRTMKEQCIWLHNFKSIEEAQTVIGQWVNWYNTQRPHQALKMKTPKQAYQLAA